MIVVSLKRSYPHLIDDLRTQPNIAMMPHRLEGITRGEWPRMKAETLEGFIDYVVGTYDDMIVAAYPFDTVELVGDSRMKLMDSTPANPGGVGSFLEKLSSSNLSGMDGEWLVGCPIPGGPWKQGESRGTRRYMLETYLDDHPEVRDRIGEDFGGRAAEILAHHYATGKAVDLEDYPQLARSKGSNVSSTPDTGVTVVRQPGGTVIVTIPTGTRAQILIEPEA